MRAANSSPRSPAKTRWVWLSTKPGITQRPAASMQRSAPAPPPARVTAATRSPSNTIAASRSVPSSGSLVTSRPMLSIASVGLIGASTSRSSRATSIDTCAPSRTIQRPPTMTSRTSAAVAQKTVPSSGGVPASRTDSSATVVRSASAPAAIRPPSGSPRLA